MTNETSKNEKAMSAAMGLMMATGSRMSTFVDGDVTATAVRVNGTSVVMVDPKAELAEVMQIVATRKRFYNKAMESLRRVYEIEKRDREFLKVAKGYLKGTKAGDGNFEAYSRQVAVAEENLAETMAMVFARKKFFNRAAASLQSIYKVESNLRTAIKIVKAAK